MDLFTQKYSALLKKSGILPVVCLKNETELNTFLDAVLRSDVRCIEITLRHPFSPSAIEYIKKNHPEITVGAGTVKSVRTLHEAIEYGADFCVAPGSADDILTEAAKTGMPFLPGGSTPTELMKLSSMGYETVKFFPSECMGGVNVLKLYEGAFSELSFLPTGGITTDNLGDYSKLKNVIACGGSFMVPKTALASGNSDEIHESITNCVATHRNNTL